MEVEDLENAVLHNFRMLKLSIVIFETRLSGSQTRLFFRSLYVSGSADATFFTKISIKSWPYIVA